MLTLISTVLLLVSTLACAATNSEQLFIHNMNPNAEWAASVQNACNGSTTYVLSCTSAPGNGGCGPQTATITEGSDFYIATTPAIYSETSATFTESCSLNSTASSASCVATIVAGNYGQDISKTIDFNLTDANGYYRYNVQITAGARRTADGGACLAKVSSGSKNSDSGLAGLLLTGCPMMFVMIGIWFL